MARYFCCVASSRRARWNSSFSPPLLRTRRRHELALPLRIASLRYFFRAEAGLVLSRSAIWLEATQSVGPRCCPPFTCKSPPATYPDNIFRISLLSPIFPIVCPCFACYCFLLTFGKGVVLSGLSSMAKSPAHRAARARRDKRLPEYALKVRQFRKECGLTQLELARELHLTPIAVARWEGAAREPNEQSYTKLVLLARQRKLKPFEGFFSARLVAILQNREHRLDEADARRFSVAIERTVPGEELERLMELSGIDRNKYIKGQVKKVIEAHGKLSNGEMVEAFSQIAFETFYADQLSKPGGLDAFRRVTRLERDLARFHQAGSAEDIEARKRRREIVEQIVNGWAIAVLEGKVPDRNELEKKLAEKNLLGAMLAKLSGIVADKLTAAREGKPYDDEKFVNDLGRALGTDRASEGEQ